MGHYNKTDKLIKPDKWYIVDTYRLNQKRRPMVIRKEFDNVEQIKHQLDIHFPNNIRFDYIKGDKALELGLYLIRAYPNLRIYLRKYRYTPDMTTDQEKKSYRTKFRRQNRNKGGQYYKRWG
jgi:hypothetical protein